MSRFGQRQSLLLSAIVHVMLLVGLASVPLRPRPVPASEPESGIEPRRVVRLRLPDLGEGRVRPPVSAPMPSPRPQTRDRISIGAPSTVRAKGPLLLRREDDLTAAANGRPDGAPALALSEARDETPRHTEAPATGEMVETPSPWARAREAGPRGAERPSIAASLRRFERRLAEGAPLGLPTGTGRQTGPLYFDPEGADFTAWINHFKGEVYRNWIVPQAALLGMQGQVDIAFTVERDGRLTDVVLLRSSGILALDRAAQNALVASRLLPLPHDFRPAQCRMQVRFYYNEGPQRT